MSKEAFGKAIDEMISDQELAEIPEFPPILAMLSSWKEWILNSFEHVEGRRLSNGPIEGFNSNFKKLLTVANGLECFSRFRNRLMYIFNDIQCISPVKEKLILNKRKARGKYKKKATV